MLIHIAGPIPRNWYTLFELRREIAEWDDLARSFRQTFSYEDEIPRVDVVMQVIKDKIFEEILGLVSNFPYWIVTIERMMECYNIYVESKDDDLRDVHFLQSEGSRELEGPGMLFAKFLEPMNIKR